MAKPRTSKTAAAPISSVDFPYKVERWSDLSVLIEYFSYYNGIPWLFRGESTTTFDLLPSVGRNNRKRKPTDADPDRRTPYRAVDERAVFDMFVQQARAYVTTNYSPLEWLAVAQHFGVPTRLLDWSDSLLAAAWFASRIDEPVNGDGRIWVVRDVPAVDTAGIADPFKIKMPRVYRPPHLSPRLGAQGSVLMICPKPTEPPILDGEVYEIVIAKNAKGELLKRLNACGVNRRTLFPDLQGLGEHLAWLYRRDWLAGYKTDQLALLMASSLGRRGTS